MFPCNGKHECTIEITNHALFKDPKIIIKDNSLSPPEIVSTDQDQGHHHEFLSTGIKAFGHNAGAFVLGYGWLLMIVNFAAETVKNPGSTQTITHSYVRQKLTKKFQKILSDHFWYSLATQVVERAHWHSCCWVCVELSPTLEVASEKWLTVNEIFLLLYHAVYSDAMSQRRASQSTLPACLNDVSSLRQIETLSVFLGEPVCLFWLTLEKTSSKFIHYYFSNHHLRPCLQKFHEHPL